MPNYIDIDSIHLCSTIDKKECNNDIKTEFIKQIKMEYFNFFKNPIVESNIDNKKVNYRLYSDNGSYIVYNEIPFHSHLDIELKKDEDIKEIAKTINNLNELCDKICNKKLTRIEFIMNIYFSLNMKIIIDDLFNKENVIKIKEKSNLNMIQMTGFDFLLKDQQNHVYRIAMSNTENKIEVSVNGFFISRRESGEKKLEELYYFIKQQIEKIIIQIGELK